MDGLIKLNDFLSNSRDLVLVITDEADVILGVVNAESGWEELGNRIQECIASQDSDYTDVKIIYASEPTEISPVTEITVHYKCDGEAYKGRYKLVRTLIF